MIFTLDRPLVLRRLLKEVAICPSTSDVIVQVGYVGLLFWGSFWEPWVGLILMESDANLNWDGIDQESLRLKPLGRLQEVGGVCEDRNEVGGVGEAVNYLQMLTYSDFKDPPFIVPLSFIQAGCRNKWTNCIVQCRDLSQYRRPGHKVDFDLVICWLDII